MHNDPGARIMERCEHLRSISESEGEYTRRYLTVEHRRAADLIGDWMAEAGLTARMDAAGNMIGRMEGAKYGLPALILGSHFDTVPNGGRYDGQLGVVTAIEVASALKAKWRSLPFAIEVYAFADEEGGRFAAGYLASGQLVEQRIGAALQIEDVDGVSLEEAMTAFGLDPDNLSAALRDPQDLVGYLELHIEQGPVLEAEDLSVATVTSIAAARRLVVSVTGAAGHAGTVPMSLRHDAIAASAEMVLQVEKIAAASRDMVGTVGRFEPASPAVNVISGSVRFSVDIRSPDQDQLARSCEELEAAFNGIAERRGVTLELEQIYATKGTKLDTEWMTVIDQACVDAQGTARRLPSGAGHDAAMMANICPSAMIFVRCREGISHHPDELITQADAAVGYRVMLGAVTRFAEQQAEAQG